ncbi:hypothetical protein SGGMMB4_01899 [Sodalis glossinidius str. 'morsitans']|uniref:Lipoprotein n=1 Tax=Sodalis glossinidius (strain morsitans) TaxID=343509 RepID=A0A193QHM2_SODGM|nr:hypothetical protein SGGMMB4_01899 [Sodalis glossinidius str. 'morsitans']
MQKLRCVIGMMGLLLGACSTQQETQPSAPAAGLYRAGGGDQRCGTTL